MTQTSYEESRGSLSSWQVIDLVPFLKVHLSRHTGLGSVGDFSFEPFLRRTLELVIPPG